MYLQRDSLVVTVGDITIRTSRLGNGSQYLFDETAIVGWTDGVDVKRNTTPRQMRSGDFQEIGHHTARYISLTGIAVATSNAELKRMRDDFTSCVPPRSYETITVRDSAGMRSATVTLGGKTSWIQQTDIYAAFKLDLYAPDPNVYGEMKTISLPETQVIGGLDMPMSYPLDFHLGQLQAQVTYNAGNNDAWPQFKVTGDYPGGFSITDNLGNFITYTGDVSRFAPVIIDTLSGSASQNGVDRSTFLSRRDWFPIQGGQTLQPSFIPNQNSSGWCDILFRDTWI